MFTAFDVKANFNFDKKWIDKGKNILEKDQLNIRKVLSDFVKPDGSIDASEMMNDWFPMVDVHAFISHSHADRVKAIGLAGFLGARFGIKAFVDSAVWGYGNELLQIIDDKHCLDDDKRFYDYQLRNRSTAHVHMMVAVALTKMLDKSECVFFLNTPNSISSKRAIGDDVSSSTLSPWIFSEIAMMGLLKRRAPVRLSKSVIAKSYTESLLPDFSYKVDLSDLISVSLDQLNQWSNGGTKDTPEASLDKFYKMMKVRGYN